MSQGSVLIIDDEEDLLDALGSALREAGFEVSTASHGGEGLALAFEKHPQIIILDVLLPLMHGSLFLERLRADDWGKTAKVIILSNLDEGTDRDWRKQYGVIDYLVKSENPLAQIVEIVQTTIKGD